MEETPALNHLTMQSANYPREKQLSATIKTSGVSQGALHLFILGAAGEQRWGSGSGRRRTFPPLRLLLPLLLLRSSEEVEAQGWQTMEGGAGDSPAGFPGYLRTLTPPYLGYHGAPMPTVSEGGGLESVS